MKLTIGKLLESSRYLATEVGQQIPDFFVFMSDLTDQVVRALRNGLTFQDNFDAEIRTTSVTHNTAQVVVPRKPGAAVQGIIPLRLVSQTHGIDSFAWYYDPQGRLTIRVGITSAPANPIQITLAILY